MATRNIKNVTHDLKPLVISLKDKVSLVKNVESSSDFIKLMKSIHSDVLIFDKYLTALEKEADEAGIEKARVQKYLIPS